MQYYAGLDVGLRSTFICVVDATGEQLHACEVASDAEAIHLSKALRTKRLPVVCMDARKVATALSTVVNKTDKNDARAIFSAIGSSPRIIYSDMPETLVPIYQYYTQANMQKLRSVGFSDEFTPLEAGVKDYLQNYLMKKGDPYL